jgi:two-component system NarL family sensor kinase
MRPVRGSAVSVPRAVGVFLLAGLVVVTVIAVVLAWMQRQQATAEAIRDARTLTNLEATDVVAPALTDAAFAPGAERDALDEVIRNHVLGSHILRVKIWDATGRVLYSEDSELVGMHFELGDEEQEALRTGDTIAEVSNLSAAENRDERQFGRLMQVYRGMRTTEGTPVLFETYQPYSVIAEASSRMWSASLPALLGGLVLLYLLQAPLAYRMARRLRRSQQEREALLLGTLAAAERERAVLAADLHDGVVQGLAGTSLTLAAAAEGAARTDPAAAATMAEAGAELRRWVRELRTLVVTVVPPALRAQGLRRSLTDLAATLEGRGIRVEVAVEDVGPVDRTSEVLVYRAAQEAVRNIVRHAAASSVRIAVTRSRGGELRLTVRDDGRGIGAGRKDARSRGSLGLELLAQLADAHGGRLEAGDAEGGGTELTLHVPLDPDQGVSDPSPEVAPLSAARAPVPTPGGGVG